MVHPVINYPIKGAIWYQGEANVGRADQYSKIFPLMIKNWRDAWGIRDFPFYFVQIAPYVYSNVDSTESGYLREAQESALKIENTGMVVALDIATVMNIHPPFKKEVGDRLANLALRNDYGKDFGVYGPVYKSMSKDGNSIKIQFDNMEGLTAKGKLSERNCRAMANLKADATSFRWSAGFLPEVKDPVSVRYCWRNGAVASLFNGPTSCPAVRTKNSFKRYIRTGKFVIFIKIFLC
jgi:sialate O-acetylesterase